MKKTNSDVPQELTMVPAVLKLTKKKERNNGRKQTKSGHDEGDPPLNESDNR